MKKLTFATIIAAIGLFFSTPVVAETIFEYKVNSFEVTGNLPGYNIDNFDDGVLAPWTTLFGTTAEVGGYAVLSNPGFPMSPPGYPNITMERSDIIAPGGFNVVDGYGNFTATSMWFPIDPDPPGGFYGMNLDYQISATEREILGIDVAHLSNIVANNLTGGPGGLQIIQVRWVYEYNPSTGEFGEGTFEEIGWYLFDEEDMTGDIGLRLFFDDSTNQVTMSFSLDGGETFLSPLSPMTSSISNEYSTMWMITGDPMEYIPEPSTFLMLAAGLALLAVLPRRGKN
jgi:hypothetical protein